MVSALVTILAVVIGFTAFVYLVSGLDHATRKKRAPKRTGVDREDPRVVFNKPWEAESPRPRICPICGTYLEKNDYLYAALDQEPPPGSHRKRQAQIYGCPYCVNPEKVSKLERTQL